MWGTFKNTSDEINKTDSEGPNGNYAIRICPWYSELMPIMSHSAAAMVGPGRSTLDEGEDKDRERLRKRIRHAKEEEREDDDNGQCDTGLEQFGLDETADTADATPSRPSSSVCTQALVPIPFSTRPDHSKVIADTASASSSVAPSLPTPRTVFESRGSPYDAPSGLLTPDSQGTAERNSHPRATQRMLSVNEKAEACSAEDQLQRLVEASEVNWERRHRDMLLLQEEENAILKDIIAAEEKKAATAVKRLDFEMWKEFLALHRAEGASYEKAKKRAMDDVKEWNDKHGRM